MSETIVYPSTQNGLHKGDPAFAGGVLVCACADAPVKVKVSAAIAHNRACGCTKCWKPEGAALLAPMRTVWIKANIAGLAAELGLIVVLPDKSPRGADLPDKKENWQFGQGCGFLS